MGSRQRAQVTSVGAAAFHWERRCRVLEREVFRLGTATSVVLVVGVRGVAHWVFVLCWVLLCWVLLFWVLLVLVEQRAERRPARVGLLVAMTGLIREPCAALDA